MTDIIIYFALMIAGVVLIAWFLRYKAASSERRMLQMLQRAGLDSEIAGHGGSDSIIKEVRRRCRRCQSEDVCERWLAGNAEGDNDFCPNAQVFKELKLAG